MANKTSNQEPTGTSFLVVQLEIGAANPNLKITTLESFDGTDDPHDHMNYYENLIRVHGYFDPIKYRLFVFTLEKKRQDMVLIPTTPVHQVMGGTQRRFHLPIPMQL